ncbi:gamma-glutamylcyclotransferase [Plutella xylostella]|uniref:gamma-glutamylcyclotransferase n=1 Tax=Plutella xylostella TaxID=51655 RepID=UPI0020321DF1|nr:gamma-glutamylcyclotransferase [Plutella xylostella]
MSFKILNESSFLYFAYGYNMCEEVIHMNNPTAELVTIGRLDNYRLDFRRYSAYWGGPSMTMVATANAHLWGVIWKLNKDDLIALDSTFGVDTKRYYPLYVDVLTPHMGKIWCRSYCQKVNPLPRGDNDPIPLEQWPSKTLKSIMVLGAKKCRLPEFYVEFLKSLKDNGEEGCYEMLQLLRRYGDPLAPGCACDWPGRYPRKPLKLDKTQFAPSNKSDVDVNKNNF